MAKYTVTRACGHTELVELLGKMKRREYLLENVEPHKLCKECYQKELEKKHQEEAEAARRFSEQENLPELQGTPKQVAWAEVIRMKQLPKYLNAVKYVKEDMRSHPVVLATIEAIRNQTSAKWWIDRRDEDGYNAIYTFKDVLNEQWKQYQKSQTE